MLIVVSLSFRWRHEVLVFKTLLDVNDVSDTVYVFAITGELIPGPFDVLGLDHLSIWVDVISCAKINNFLSLPDSSDEGSTNTLSVEHKWHLTNVVKAWGQSKLNERSLFLQQWHIGHKLMIS